MINVKSTVYLPINLLLSLSMLCRGLLEEWGHNGSSLPIICHIMHRMAVEDVNQTVCLLLFCTQWQETKVQNSLCAGLDFSNANWTFDFTIVSVRWLETIKR